MMKTIALPISICTLWQSICLATSHFLLLLTLPLFLLLTLLCLPVANNAKPCRSLLKLLYVCSSLRPPGLCSWFMPALFVSLSFFPSQPHSLSCPLSLSLISLSIYTDLITRTFFKALHYKAFEGKVHSLLFKLTSLLHSAWPNHGFSTWLLVHLMSCSLTLP